MDIKQFINQIKSKESEIRTLIHRTLPIKVGRIAKNHFQDNFKKSGFVNGGLHPWEQAKRLTSGSTAAKDNHKTLLSGRKVLYNATNYTPGNGTVRLYNNAPYAGIHNNGGTTNPSVTPKMRKYAWAKYYQEGGGVKGEEPPTTAQKWKGLALTKKTKLSIKIPQRQFIGPSKELDQAIQDEIIKQIKQIIN